MTSNSREAELEMLAVRLPGGIVDALRAYASSYKETLHQLITDFVQGGIARDIGRLNKSSFLENASTKKEIYARYRKAQERGEIIPWTEKQMLAVRIRSELMETLRAYSLDVKKNISLLLEEFIYAGLADRRGESIDAQTLAALTRESASPFRERKAKKNTSKNAS